MLTSSQLFQIHSRSHRTSMVGYLYIVLYLVQCRIIYSFNWNIRLIYFARSILLAFANLFIFISTSLSFFYRWLLQISLASILIWGCNILGSLIFISTHTNFVVFAVISSSYKSFIWLLTTCWANWKTLLLLYV